MIKAAFFDLDGTLLSSDGRVSHSTKQAIQLLKKRGVLCGIATGRSPFSAKQLIKNVSFDVCISYNGQYIFNDKEVLYKKELSKEIIQRLIDYGNQEQKRLVFGGAHTFVGKNHSQKLEGSWAICLKNKLSRKMQKKIMHFYHEKSFLRHQNKRYVASDLLKEPIYQCMLHASAEECYYLEEAYDDWTFTRSNLFSVDIISKGASKLQGIDHVIAPLGIKREEVLAFGDSYNDIEMIEGVGIGVAMGNGEIGLQLVADHVTRTNDEDGIYVAVNALLKKEDGK